MNAVKKLAPGRGEGCSFVQQRVDHLGHAGPLLRGQGAVFVDDRALVGVQVVGGGIGNGITGVCVTGNIVDCRIEIIRHLLQRVNIGFNSLVFVVIDGLLTGAEIVCQRLLTDSFFPS